MNPKGSDILIKANNISICYDDLGEGEIPVIFIHGFPFDKSSWQPQLDFLKNKNRVIAYDIRGFGKTVADETKFTIDLFADDLIKLMDSLQIDKAIVCGLSMGGYILLNAIGRYPERFCAIILSDTQCIADSAEGKEKRFKTIKQIEDGGLAIFAETFIKNIFCSESLLNKTELIEKIKKIILSTSVRTYMETLKALADRNETCSTLNSIKVPTLILCGKEDVVTPLAQSESLMMNIKESVFHSINGAGHMSNLEQLDQFNGHINDFISGLSKYN